MQQQQYTRGRLSQPASLVLACLMAGPKDAIAMCEAIERAEGIFIEPGTLYRVLRQLERRGWIEAIETEKSLRPYAITNAGLHALQGGEEQRHHTHQREGHTALQRGKEFIMRLVLWILWLYPRGWRERYETEMVALLEQHEISFWTVLDLLMGAVDAQLDPHYRRERQLFPLRRFQTSWWMAISAFAVFWIALLPWLWMSVLGFTSDNTNCSNWTNNYALCVMRMAVGTQQSSLAQALLQWFLILLPLLLVAFTVILVVAHGKKARTHLLLAGMVAAGMAIFSIACGFWLSTIWPLFPQIGQFYPQTPAELLAGLVGMGITSALALVALVRAAITLKALSATAPKREPHAHSTNEQGGENEAVHRLAASTFTSRARSVSKRWMIVVLGVLVLLFVLPWPNLITNDNPNWNLTLTIWFLTAILGLITALLVKSPGKQQVDRARRKPRRETSPMVWAAILPIPYFLIALQVAIPRLYDGFSLLPLRAMLLYSLPASLVSGLTALIIFLRNREPRIEKPLRVGIIAVTAIWLVFMFTGIMRFVFFPIRGEIGGSLLLIFLCILPASFVRVRRTQAQRVHDDNQQPDAAPEQFQSGSTPKVWGIFLLTLLFINVFLIVGSRIFPPAFWNNFILLIFVMAICLIPAVAVKARRSRNQGGSATQQPPTLGVSPKVWILILPIWFLTFCMHIILIISPDYNSYAQVFVAWVLTGLAGLIILLTVRIGSNFVISPGRQQGAALHFADSVEVKPSEM